MKGEDDKNFLHISKSTYSLTINFYYFFRFSEIGVVSYGEECPSVGIYGRVTEVKHWIQSIARGALDSSCNEEIEFQPGNSLFTLYRGGQLSDTGSTD